MKITREQFDELKSLSIFKGKVVTNSMEPVIMVGDDIVIDVGYSDIKRFDIIVIFMDGKLVCHYLWSKNKIVTPVLLQTRNMSGKLDYPVEMKDYLGKVVNFKISFWRKLRIIF